MTAIENAYTVALDARIAHEVNAHANAKKFLTDARAFCAIEAHATFLQNSNVAAFFNDNENALKKVCMKMIDRSVDYARAAVSKSYVLTNKRALCVLKTMINCHKAKVRMTRADAIASATSATDKRVTATNKTLIAHCDNQIDAYERQASMSLLALQNMNVIREVARNEFEFTSEAIAKALLKRYA